MAEEEDQDTRRAQRDRLMAASQRAFPILSRNAPPTWGELMKPTEGEAEVQPSGRSRIRPSTPPASPPPLGVYPSERPPPSRSDPTRSNPMRPPIVTHWMAVYEVEGRQGLQEEFYKFAQKRLDSLDSKDQSNERSSWGLLLRDKEEGTHVVACLLALLPDKVILALLAGELPLQCQEDAEVRAFVDTHMQLKDTPGIYVNLLHNVDNRWLSSQDLEALIAKVERYLQVEPSGLPRDDQTAIDTPFSKWAPGSKESKLRWLQGQDRPETVIREWINTVKEIYCKNPIDVTTAFRMGPAEVGWASNTKTRCRQHATNSSTTYLWGLLNAICRSPGPSGFNFPVPMQLVLFPIWERDEMLCKVGEVVGSMLCSSYWYLGGLNCFHAGTIIWDPEGGARAKDKLRPVSSTNFCWGNNARAVHDRLESIRPLVEEERKAKRLDDAFAESEKSKVVEGELKDLKIRLENARKERKDLEEKAEAIRSSLKLDAADAADAALDEIIKEIEEDSDRWIRDVLLKD